MPYKALYILVEGDDDKRFFETIVKPMLGEKYDSVALWKYAQEKNRKVTSFLSSVRRMAANYIYVSDIDRARCITARKEGTQDKFENIDRDRIIVVISEIESWYLAGLDDRCCRKFGISPCATTDNITKEQFNRLIPKKFDSRIDFMLEILKCFSIEMAKQKNASFRYFLQKHNCEV